METTDLDRLVWVLSSMTDPLAKRVGFPDPSTELVAAAVIVLKEPNPVAVLARVRLTHAGQTQGLGALEPHALLLSNGVAIDPCIGSIGRKLGWKSPGHAIFELKPNQRAFTGSLSGFTYRVELDNTMERRMIERIEANSSVVLECADAMEVALSVSVGCSTYREFAEQMQRKCNENT